MSSRQTPSVVQQKSKIAFQEVGLKWNSRAVERMMASCFGIDDARIVAFRGRLDHLRRYGCPAGVNTGKGKPAAYGWSQLIELTIALALVDIGLSPEISARFVRRSIDQVLLEVSLLISRGRENGELPSAIHKQEWPIQSTRFMHGSASALAGLKSDGGVGDCLAGFFQLDEMADWISSTHDIARSMFLIDLGTKLIALVNTATDWSEMTWSATDPPVEQVFADLAMWAEEIADRILEKAIGNDT